VRWARVVPIRVAPTQQPAGSSALPLVCAPSLRTAPGATAHFHAAPCSFHTVHLGDIWMGVFVKTATLEDARRATLASADGGEGCVKLAAWAGRGAAGRVGVGWEQHAWRVKWASVGEREGAHILISIKFHCLCLDFLFIQVPTSFNCRSSTRWRKTLHTVK